ncbi:hypothetical protein GCM10023079_38550 [Streptomyces chitinivorans]
MTTAWNPDAAGVLRLPSGRLVRRRGLRRPLPAGPAPTFALYLLGKEPPAVSWDFRRVRWPDFRLPSDGGGHGRTGTALARLAVLDGLPGDEAVAHARGTTPRVPSKPPGSAASSAVSRPDADSPTPRESHSP